MSSPPPDFLELINNLNCMDLVFTYTPSWHRHSNHQIPDEVERKNGFMIHSLHPAVYTDLPNGRVNVESIYTDTKRGRDIKLPLNPPPEYLRRDLKLYWAALGRLPRNSRNSPNTNFQIYQYKKHMKYFHTHHLYEGENINMWPITMELAKKYVSARSPLNLMNIILERYQIGQQIDCNAFVNFLSSRLGRAVHVTFSKVDGKLYFYEIHILFSITGEMINYITYRNNFRFGDVFILEGDHAVLRQEMHKEEMYEEVQEEEEMYQAGKRKKWNWKKPFGLFRMCFGRN